MRLGTDRCVTRLTTVVIKGRMAVKIYMLILLVGAIATLAHMSSMPHAIKSGRLGFF